MTQGIGDRHPLGIGAGGLAILAALSDNERRIVMDTIAPQLKRYRLSEKTLNARVQSTIERGTAVDEGSASVDVTALGRVIHDRQGTPVGAVFVASISMRMVESRQLEVEKRLVICIQNIESRFGR